ncbi:MAG: Zn-binding domain-containing protein, partial [Candidatus Micrarchaeota archaeon]
PASKEDLGAEALACLVSKGLAKEWAGRAIPTKKGVEVLREMSIRGTASTVRIYDCQKEQFIGERDEHIAMGELFPGAIYLHGGERYESEGLDLEKKIAHVRKIEVDDDEYTIALREKNADVETVESERDVLGLNLSYGKVHVIDEIYGYNVKDYLKNTIVKRKRLDEPLCHEFDTYALWVDFPEEIVASVRNFGDGLHAVEHISIAMMPALTGADPSELGGISYPAGRMYVYDGVPGGAGLAKISYEKFEKIMRMAYSRIDKCKCADGCPSCIFDPQCGNNNKYLSKGAGISIFKEIFRR